MYYQGDKSPVYYDDTNNDEMDSLQTVFNSKSGPWGVLPCLLYEKFLSMLYFIGVDIPSCLFICLGVLAAVEALLCVDRVS